MSTSNPTDPAATSGPTRAAYRVAFLAMAASVVLGACTTGQVWVGPPGMGPHGEDLDACRYHASMSSERQIWFERQRLQREAWWARSPSERAFANARLHQIETLSSLDRQRSFETCMQARGYRLQQAGP